jgi:hypothetical protein
MAFRAKKVKKRREIFADRARIFFKSMGSYYFPPTVKVDKTTGTMLTISCGGGFAKSISLIGTKPPTWSGSSYWDSRDNTRTDMGTLAPKTLELKKVWSSTCCPPNAKQLYDTLGEEMDEPYHSRLSAYPTWIPTTAEDNKVWENGGRKGNGGKPPYDPKKKYMKYGGYKTPIGAGTYLNEYGTGEKWHGKALSEAADSKYCYRGLFGETDSCTSKFHVKIFTCKGCSCNCRTVNGKKFCQLVKVSTSHNLEFDPKEGKKPGCMPWFNMVDSSMRGLIGAVREEANNEKLAQCGNKVGSGKEEYEQTEEFTM